VDGFTGQEPEVPMSERPEIDRWIISLLNTLVRNVTESLENYDPTPAARMIQEFVCENLSNWYVRLNRKRFWGGGLTRDKLACLPDALHLSGNRFDALRTVRAVHLRPYLPRSERRKRSPHGRVGTSFDLPRLRLLAHRR